MHSSLKACAKCHAAKPIDEFYKRSGSPDRTLSACKKCMNEESRRYNATRKFPPSTTPQTCVKCRETKPADEFYNNRRRRSGKMSACIACDRARNRASHGDRWKRLGYLFGLTEECYNTILRLQGGMCAICPATTPGGHGVWCVDHDHSCCPGKKTCGRCVRGLLCFNCNVLLGNAKDDISVLESAIRYLKERGLKSEGLRT